MVEGNAFYNTECRRRWRWVGGRMVEEMPFLLYTLNFIYFFTLYSLSNE